MGSLTSNLLRVKEITDLVGGIVGTARNITGDVKNFTSSGDPSRLSQLKKEQDLALRQLQTQQRERERQAAAQDAIDRQKIAGDAASAEQQRLAALRRAVARQRAQFGGAGLAAEEPGSAQAVLLGLFDESEDERAERDRLDNLRTRVLDENLSSQKRLNVLQVSQLKERQRLEREMLR